jgi:hypothetical protein
MAWKWICISLDSWMVVLMDMVQYCTVSYIPGAQGGSQFLDLVIFCFGVEISLYKLIYNIILLNFVFWSLILPVQYRLLSQ